MNKYHYIIVLGLSWCPSLIAKTINPHLCNTQWHHVLSGPAYTGLGAKIAYWKSLAPTCAGSGLYEFRLGNLYTQAGQYRLAKRTLREGLALNTPYRKDLLVADGDIAFNERHFSDAWERYRKILKAYPDWNYGYLKVGALELALRQYTKAASYLEEANQHGKNPYTYALLTTAYFRLHRYKDAVKAFNAGFDLDQRIAADRLTMFSAAISYATLGRNHRALDMLLLLRKENPAEGNDPAWGRMLDRINGRLAQHQNP